MAALPPAPGGDVDALYARARAAAAADPAAAPPGEAPPAVARVAEEVRAIAVRTPTLPPATHTNAYLVGPEAGPQLLVDPGSPYPDQQAALDALLADEARAGRPLALVALTHHHGDHVGGARHAAARWGVPVLAHRATAARLAGRVPVDRLVEDGEVLALGATRVRARHTPGHAAGHLCFSTATATVAGDLVAGVGTILIDPDEGDMTAYLASLEAVAAAAPGLLLPAHGPPIPDGVARLRGYVAHRLRREAAIVAALAARPASTLDELVAEAYADTPRALWPLAARSLLAHLARLRQDGRARVVDDDRWAAG